MPGNEITCIFFEIDTGVSTSNQCRVEIERPFTNLNDISTKLAGKTCIKKEKKNKTKQNKTKQNKTKQNKTKQNTKNKTKTKLIHSVLHLPDFVICPASAHITDVC